MKLEAELFLAGHGIHERIQDYYQKPKHLIILGNQQPGSAPPLEKPLSPSLEKLEIYYAGCQEEALRTTVGKFLDGLGQRERVEDQQAFPALREACIISDFGKRTVLFKATEAETAVSTP